MHDYEQNQFADIIPDPETIRLRIDRAQREAALLRRLLRLALQREREAECLTGRQEVSTSA